MSWAPIPDRAAARVVGDALRRVGYTEDSVLELLGEDGYALTAGPASAAGVVAAAAVVGIAGTGLLFAWRAVTGASFD